MKVTDFDFELPEELIAQVPAAERSDSRLLQVDDTGQLIDRQFSDLVEFAQAGDLLVLNNTRVIAARLYGRKESGGKVEILLERIISEDTFLAQIKASRSPKEDSVMFIDGDEKYGLLMLGRQGGFFILQRQERTADAVSIEQPLVTTNAQPNAEDDLIAWFNQHGHMPLPPYVSRDDNELDASRYQTVYAKEQGAVAAPTAGLHYTDSLLDDLRRKGIEITYITLHVGAGTYQPVRVENIDDHQMHSEWLEVDENVCQQIQECKQKGGRVIAAGTTVVRSLETAAASAENGLIEPYKGETEIFIFPGFEFKVVDVLQTNFHLPQSTLLMLVSAFSGSDVIRRAYQHAIEQSYRFFSYGDSMLLERAKRSG